MELGATTDRELCKQAQDIALNELAGVYDSIYTNLESLLTVKVNEGNSLSAKLTVAGLTLAIAIVIVVVIAMILSTKIGKRIAKVLPLLLENLGSVSRLSPREI